MRLSCTMRRALLSPCLQDTTLFPHKCLPPFLHQGVVPTSDSPSKMPACVCVCMLGRVSTCFMSLVCFMCLVLHVHCLWPCHWPCLWPNLLLYSQRLQTVVRPVLTDSALSSGPWRWCESLSGGGAWTGCRWGSRSCILRSLQNGGWRWWGEGSQGQR